jgi:hypothetical protein
MALGVFHVLAATVVSQKFSQCGFALPEYGLRSNSFPLHGIPLLSRRLHYQDEAEHDHDHSEQYALGTKADRRNQ